MAVNAKVKGSALEQAVAFIQKTLLKHDPNLKGANFSVETNKLFFINGSRYEADVFVVIAPDSTFESTCIFECKNWRKPVGRKEITDLSDKVDVIGANRGFLVSKEITADALAKLQEDKRLTYIPCNETFASQLNFRLIHTEYDILQVTIHLKQRGAAPRPHPETINAQGKLCQLNGEPVLFDRFILNQVNELVSKTFHQSGRVDHEGTHWFECAAETIFSTREFLIESIEFETMWLSVRCFARVRQRKIISKFELAEQGRFISFEPLDSVIYGKQIEVKLVQLI